MDKYKDIRAYRVGWILAVIDWFTVLPILKIWALRTTKGIRLEYLGERKQIERDIKHGAFFLTNHRDIILDAAWLSYRLRLRYFIRPFMGVGNNLFAKPWIEHLMRFLRCFVVKRGAGAHAQLENAKQLSAYIRMLRSQGHSIWLAQREGRAKDGNDRTQPSVLKMLTLSAENNHNLIDQIKVLNICPVSLSYEYDPCDFLKAAEMQLKRDNPNWRKSKKDDILSMKTGINGYKGKVVFRMTPSINHWIDAHRAELEEMTKNDLLHNIAAQIDKQIFLGYEIFTRGTEFDNYIESRIALINIPNKDEAFLREKLYEMYRYPEINFRQADALEKNYK